MQPEKIKNAKKIIHLLPSFLTGGAEKLCVHLCNYMAETAGQQVVLISLYDIDEKAMFLQKEVLKNVKIITLSKKKGLDIGLFFHLFKTLKLEKPNVLHAHVGALFYAFFYIIFQKTATFYTMHTLAPKELGNRAMRWVYQLLFRSQKVQIIAVSEEVQASAKQLYGSKILSHFVPNGVSMPQTSENFEQVQQELSILRKDEKTMLFLNVARPDVEKNQIILLNIFKRLKNAHLIVIGSPQIEREERYFSDHLQPHLSENITWLAQRPNIADYLTLVDVFCIPSLREGLPMTLIEAMAMQRICLTTPIGSMAQVIKHQENGYLSESTSEKDFETQILNILAMGKSELQAIQKNASQTYKEKYSIAICGEKYLYLYEN